MKELVLVIMIMLCGTAQALVIDRGVLVSGMSVSETQNPEDTTTVLVANKKPRINLAEFYVDVDNNSTTITKLTKLVHSITYDPQEKLLIESKSPDAVLETGLGNCFEVARLVHRELQKEGYESRILVITVGNTKHAICVFTELDGTLSIFQATGGLLHGYTKGNTTNLQELLNNTFLSIKNYEHI